MKDISSLTLLAKMESKVCAFDDSVIKATEIIHEVRSMAFAQNKQNIVEECDNLIKQSTNLSKNVKQHIDTYITQTMGETNDEA